VQRETFLTLGEKITEVSKLTN